MLKAHLADIERFIAEIAGFIENYKKGVGSERGLSPERKEQ